MRVIAGKAKGRRLKTGRLPDLRPTSDKVKEALFSILAPQIEGARMLDLFGGAGGIGIEALSRGAAWVDFVESDPETLHILEQNLFSSGLKGHAGVYCMDAFRFIKQVSTVYDLVFADPPYVHPRILKKLLPALGQGVIISNTGLTVVEHFRKVRVPNKIGQLEVVRSCRYGDTILTFYCRGKSLDENRGLSGDV